MVVTPGSAPALLKQGIGTPLKLAVLQPIGSSWVSLFAGDGPANQRDPL
jgi:hypothetical protein